MNTPRPQPETRLCMIGAGYHASRIVYSCFPLLRNAVVVANCDLNEEAAKKVASRYGISRSYSDYKTMIEVEKPDGVIICVNGDFHGRVGAELLRAGYPVYTEKPPAKDLAQGLELRAARQESGRVYMTGFKKRFAPAYVKAKRVIEDAGFGEKTLLTITRTSGPTHAGSDSVNTYLHENSIHVVDLATYLFGPVRSVLATARPVATAILTLEFECGAIGTVSVTDRMSYDRGWEVVTVIGGDGVLIQVDNSVEMTAFKKDVPFAAHKPEFVAGGSQSAIEQGFSGELQGFVEAIRSGAQPDANIDNVVHVLSILAAVRESLATGQRVHVPVAP